MGRVHNFICIYTNKYYLKKQGKKKERTKRNKIKNINKTKSNFYYVNIKNK